jgi:hypothetical protein
MRAFISSAFLVVLISTVVGQDVFVYHKMNQPLLLPPYPGPELGIGVVGKIEVHVHFKNGKAASSSVSKTNIISSNDYENRYSSLLDLWERNLLKVISQWDTPIVGEYDSLVLIEYKVDKSIKSNTRTYQVEYDTNHDIPSRITIIGPMLLPPK